MFFSGTVVWHRLQATSGREPTRSTVDQNLDTGWQNQSGTTDSAGHCHSSSVERHHSSLHAFPDELFTRFRRFPHVSHQTNTPHVWPSVSSHRTHRGMSTSYLQLPTLPLDGKFCQPVAVDILDFQSPPVFYRPKTVEKRNIYCQQTAVTILQNSRRSLSLTSNWYLKTALSTTDQLMTRSCANHMIITRATGCHAQPFRFTEHELVCDCTHKRCTEKRCNLSWNTKHQINQLTNCHIGPFQTKATSFVQISTLTSW